MRGLASEIVLVDVDQARAEGEAMDISHGALFTKMTSVRAGGFADTAGSDLVIITAGSNQKPGETRLDLMARNAAIMREVSGAVARHSPDTVLLIVANPVDVMSYVAARHTGFPPARVIGSGTVLDSSRFRHLLSRHFGGIDTRDIHGYILGEHGDTAVPAWSLVNIAGMGIDEAARAFGVDLGEAVRREITTRTRRAAYDIIEGKHATYYGIAMATMRIVEAIIRDEQSIMSCSTLVDGAYGVSDVYLSLPLVLGEHGVREVFTPELPDDELAALRHSADVLREAQASVMG
jgi:L-lactate dehydrogenase